MLSEVSARFWIKALVFLLLGFAGRVAKVEGEVLYSVLLAEMNLVW